MEKLSLFVFICCLLALHHCISIDPIDCTDLSTKECRYKFRDLYIQSAKEIHIEAINDFYDLIKSISNNIINELPADDQIGISLKTTLNKLSENIEQLNANKADDEKVTIIVMDMMKSLVWAKDIMRLTADNDYKRLAEKHKLTELLSNRLFKLMHDMGKMYTDTYAGLREIDLKAIKEYDADYEAMDKLQTTQDDQQKIDDYFARKRLRAGSYDLPNFLDLSDSSFEE